MGDLQLFLHHLADHLHAGESVALLLKIIQHEAEQQYAREQHRERDQTDTCYAVTDMTLRHIDNQAHVRGRQDLLEHNHVTHPGRVTAANDERAVRAEQLTNGIVVGLDIFQQLLGPNQGVIGTGYAHQFPLIVVHFLRISEHRIGMCTVVVRQTPAALVATQCADVPVALLIGDVILGVIQNHRIFIHPKSSRATPLPGSRRTFGQVGYITAIQSRKVPQHTLQQVV